MWNALPGHTKKTAVRKISHWIKHCLLQCLWRQADRDALDLKKRSVDSGLHKMSMSDKCYRCGKTSRDARDCWFKDKVCRKCNKPGHIQRVCRQKSDNKQVQSGKTHKDKKSKFKAKCAQGESGSETESDTKGLASLE